MDEEFTKLGGVRGLADEASSSDAPEVPEDPNLQAYPECKLGHSFFCCYSLTSKVPAGNYPAWSCNLPENPPYSYGLSVYNPFYQPIDDAEIAFENPVGPHLGSLTMGKQTSFSLENHQQAGCVRLQVPAQGTQQVTRSSTVGGLITFQNRIMLQTVGHIFEDPLEATHGLVSPGSILLEDEDDDFEITGWSDTEDDNDEADLVEVTSRGSSSPPSKSESSEESDTVGVDTSTVISGNGLAAHVAEFQNRSQSFAASSLHQPIQTILNTNGNVFTGEIVMFSQEEDIALVEVTRATIQQSGLGVYEPNAVPLETFEDHVAFGPQDAAIKVPSSETGTIGGRLSGTVSLFCPPGSRKLLEVYTAELYHPLRPGDCGALIRDAVSNKIYGHVIAGSPSGLVIIVPSHRAFQKALDTLSDRSNVFHHSYLGFDMSATSPLYEQSVSGLQYDPYLIQVQGSQYNEPWQPLSGAQSCVDPLVPSPSGPGLAYPVYPSDLAETTPHSPPPVKGSKGRRNLRSSSNRPKFRRT